MLSELWNISNGSLIQLVVFICLGVLIGGGLKGSKRKIVNILLLIAVIVSPYIGNTTYILSVMGYQVLLSIILEGIFAGILLRRIIK